MGNKILDEERILEGIKCKVKGIEEDSITKEDVIGNFTKVFVNILEDLPFSKRQNFPFFFSLY